MIELLIIAQIVFYLTASIAIVTVGFMLFFTVYHLSRVSKRLDSIVTNLGSASEDLKERIEILLENLESLPILSFLFKRKSKNIKKSGRSLLRSKPKEDAAKK